MSLIPRNTTPFPQHLWDAFFSSPFPSFSLPFSGRTLPYSEYSLETSSGTVTTKLECTEVDEAHLITAELPGVEKHQVDVAAEDGGFVRISGGGVGESKFLWRVRMPGDACLGMMTWSMENAVLTVVVPKMSVGVDYFTGGGWDLENSRRINVRQIDIEGDD